MKKVLLILVAAALTLTSYAQEDRFAQLDSLMNVFCNAIVTESIEEKQAEVEFMIESCNDSLTREHVARALFDHYADSRVMGEEALAIFIYDNWFANGKLSIGGEYVEMEANIFATFNRNSLIGMDAPQIELRGPEEEIVKLPSNGRTSILFFFDTSCSKCRLDIVSMPAALRDVDFPVDFYAVYCGSDKASWDEFRGAFDPQNPNIHVIHAWDPEYDSDYQRLYAVISTPRLYVIEPQGTIMGRRLEPDSLKELLYYAGALQKTYDNFKSE